MSGNWELRLKPPPSREMRLVATTCDRCGKPATIVGAPARAWGEAQVAIQGEGFYYADLCADCSRDLREWINAGPGEGMVDELTRANEPSAAHEPHTEGPDVQ